MLNIEENIHCSTYTLLPTSYMYNGNILERFKLSEKKLFILSPCCLDFKKLQAFESSISPFHDHSFAG